MSSLSNVRYCNLYCKSCDHKLRTANIEKEQWVSVGMLLKWVPAWSEPASWLEVRAISLRSIEHKCRVNWKRERSARSGHLQRWLQLCRSPSRHSGATLHAESVIMQPNNLISFHSSSSKSTFFGLQLERSNSKQNCVGIDKFRALSENSVRLELFS